MKSLTQNFFFLPILIGLILFGVVGYIGGLSAFVFGVTLTYRSSIREMRCS